MGTRVADKVALVTGGASGIGAGCALRLAEEGASVIITDIDDKLGQETVARINHSGGKASYINLDVRKEDAWQAVIASIKSQYGKLNILVNNAGIGIGGSIVEMSLEDWQHQQSINLDGVFLGIKHSIPLMNESGSGSIINLSSVAGMKGAANLSAYNATKGGVRLFSKGVALECAAQKWPIRVNSIHPGIIDTPIWTKIDADMLQNGENAINVDAMAEIGVPMGFAGKPLDIANGVLFLASDESSYMTGTELVIDGGICA